MFATIGAWFGRLGGSIIGWIGNPFNWLALWLYGRAKVRRERQKALEKIVKTKDKQLDAFTRPHPTWNEFIKRVLRRKRKG